MRRLIAATAVLLLLLTSVPAPAGQSPEALILGLLMEDLGFEERKERLAQAFRRLERAGDLTPGVYRKLVGHPAGQMFYPEINDALARSAPETALGVFKSVLKDPPDLPYDRQLDLRRAVAYSLSELTESNDDDGLFNLLRHQGDLELQVYLAGSYAESRRNEVQALAVGWSRNLDQAHLGDAGGAQNDPLEGQRQLSHRRELNRLLSRIGTQPSLAELTASLEKYIGYAPSWLVRDGIELLGMGRHQPAYPLARGVALDEEQELTTRTAALKAMLRLYLPEKKNDLERVARRLLADAKGEREFPEVKSVLDALDEK